MSAHAHVLHVYLPRLVLALALPSVAFAGTDVDWAQAAKSPYTLASFVNGHAVADWAPLWKTLGINENLVQLTTCGAQLECRPQLIAIDRRQVILLLHGGITGWEEVYLRFLRSGTPKQSSAWKYAGYYSNLTRQAHPRHELIRLGGRPYLLLTSESQQAGVGWRSVDQGWFDLTAKTFEPVFWLAIEDWDAGLLGRVALHSRARVLSYESHPVERITVAYEVGFATPFGTTQDNLGSRSARAIYTRRGSKFVFDSHLSDAPEAEIEKLYGFGVDRLPSNEDFLQYLLPRLKEIASATNADQRDWLEQFLTLCKDTPEKREILAILRRL